MKYVRGKSGRTRVRSALNTVVFSGLLCALISSLPARACEDSANCSDDLSLLLASEQTSISPDTSRSNSGISISVDGETIVGTPSRDDVNRQTDIDLAAVDIQVKFDGLNVERSLSVSTYPEKRVHMLGAPILFQGNWNYAKWIARAEVRIYSASSIRKNPAFDTPLQIVEMGSDGKAEWSATDLQEGQYLYSVRVYDWKGRFDESDALPIVLSANEGNLQELSLLEEQNGRGLKQQRPASSNPGLDNNQLAVSNIPIHGGSVTVYGKNLPDGFKVNVLGRQIPVSNNNDFVTQSILPAGEHVVDVSVSDASGEHGVEFQRDINIPDNEWFYVGIADVTIGKRTGKDSQYLAPANPGEYNNVYKKGRLAFYLKGKIKGRYIITAALDTNEEDLDSLFSNLDKKDPRQLLRRLDPDDYYPVYGDDSTFKEDAPTSGKFYVRIERGNSHVMWGNFKTKIDGVELTRYERGLYGASANLETDKTTSFGEPLAAVQGFAAQPGTLPQRDEFQGTGGSLYFLKRQDINQGSEQITIEIRDSTTGLVVERRVLKEGEGYTIDYVQGVIILSEPLASTATSSSAVLPSSLANYDQFLVANYEYTPTLEDVSGYSYGARGEAWVFDQVRFGATGYQENTGYADQTLFGADVTWRLSENSYFQFEWARSEGNNFATVTSSDGGFIFNPISGDGVDGAADAWRARMYLDLAELTNNGLQGSIGAGYEERDKGFNGPGRYTQTGEKILDAHLEIKAGEDTTITGRYDDVQRADGVSKREASAEIKARINEGFSVQIGAQYSNTNSASLLADGTGARTDIGGRITAHGFGQDEFYVFGQATVNKDASRADNDRIGVGFKADISDKLNAEGQASVGTSGTGLLAALNYEPTAKDKYYIGYRMIPDTTGGDMISYDPFGRDNGTVVTGMRKQVNDSFAAWTEHNFDMMGTSQGLLQTYGVEYTPNPLWNLSAGLEVGTIEDETDGNFDRIAPSFQASFKDEGKTFGTKLEVRFEDSQDDTRDRTTWLGKANLGLQYNDNWRFLAKADAAISNSDQTAVLDADYIEASIGWAYRPVENDRLNALFKYTYLHELPAPSQVNADSVTYGPKQRSHVLSADFVYDLSDRLSVGAKYGIRAGEVSASRDEADFVKSTAQLAIVRADYHVVKNWDVLLEGRALWLSELDQVNYGVLAGVYRHIGDNLKLGVGYNFGRFSDDLTDLTLDDEGVFVNVIGKF